MVYVEAPVGTMVNELPKQIAPLLTPTVGVAFTVTLATAEAEETHPSELVPITE